MYRGHTFTLNRDAEAWAKQIEVQAKHIVAGGDQQVPEGYGIGNLIDGYAQECNMGGRTKPATHATLKRELATIPLEATNAGTHRRPIPLPEKATPLSESGPDAIGRHQTKKYGF